jgi:hypothetical protein
METKSGIMKDYDGRFVLDEPRLRKFVDILQSFGHRDGGSCQVGYLAYTKDDHFITGANLTDVLSLQNASEREIAAVYLYLERKTKAKTTTLCKVKFLKTKSTISVEVEHEDRDWALLLIGELEAQIEATHERRRFYYAMQRGWIDYVVLAAVLFMILFVAFKYVTSYNQSHHDAVAKEISSLSMDEKLLRIFFENTIKLDTPLSSLVLTVLMMGSLVYLQKKPLSTWFRRLNRSFFAWGMELERYKRYLSLETNIKWVVIVGVVVSLGSSLLLRLAF